MKSGVGFVDIAVLRGAAMHLLELKVLRSKFAGARQLQAYMRAERRQIGWLVVFDGRAPGKKPPLPARLAVPEGAIQIVIGPRTTPWAPVCVGQGELRDLAARLDVEGKLRRYHSALLIPEDPRAKGSHYFLLELQPRGTTLQVTPFGRRNLNEATGQYLEAEKKIRDNPESGGQVVLVSVDSLKTLRRAYPNYYLDTDEFLRAVNRAIS